jgi:hypothetical protein
VEDLRAAEGRVMIAAPDVDLPGQPLLPEDQRLPVLMLSQYLFFLSRRPVSESNLHYLVSRLEGLQSLAPVFAGSESPVLQQVVAQLRHLHPAAFRRLAPSLQLSLLPLAKAARPLPSDVIVSDCALDARWLADVRHALLVLGPGIGIGDELILAPLPQWLKNENPSLEVTTLSGYKGFWSRVKGVDHERQYSAHLDLLKALRGGEPYDLVIFADFEAPELYRGVAADGGVKKYLEITLGARSAFLFDSQRRWLHRLLHVTPYFANYYYALNQLLRSIGLDPEAGDRFADVVRRETPKAADRLDIFVTPFTSKYDPSCAWWSRLLTGIVRRVGPFPVTLHVDSGKHWKTRHFAIELARSVSPMLPPNVTLELARDSGSQALTLPRVYDYLDRCHAVICADSFAAHAGPLFDCLTLVLAKGELKDWQVPSDNSFYFDPESSVDGVAAAMGDLLQETLRPKSAMQLAAAFTAAELNVCAAADGLQAALRNRDPIDDAFTGRYREFAGYHRAVTAQRRQQPALLFRDSFGDAIRAPESSAGRTRTSPSTFAALRAPCRNTSTKRWPSSRRRAARRSRRSPPRCSTPCGPSCASNFLPARSRPTSVSAAACSNIAAVRSSPPSSTMPSAVSISTPAGSRPTSSTPCRPGCRDASCAPRRWCAIASASSCSGKKETTAGGASTAAGAAFIPTSTPPRARPRRSCRRRGESRRRAGARTPECSPSATAATSPRASTHCGFLR